MISIQVSVSVSFIHSDQRDVGAWGTMHELVFHSLSEVQ